MAKYTKKPVTIEAIEFIGINYKDIIDFVGPDCSYDSGTGQMIIFTLEGVHRADIGDMIIKGVKGEFYPCKPDIFALTYQPEEG
ncbi:MAG: hypothetical protein KGI54_18860 [Pseudomonadota bacterium]|nr:hypothetical protein [Pseudomonadota bacterium]